nr:hypothetical protein [Tanacetum cinerariifolium]
PYVPEPEYPEYIPVEDEVFLAEEQPLPAPASTTADSPGYIPEDVAEEEALTTLEGVNTRVTELTAVQEQDTQDIYGVMEDAQGRQTEMFQRFETLVDDSRYHYETGRLVDQEARCEIQALQAREQARAGTPEGAGSST